MLNQTLRGFRTDLRAMRSARKTVRSAASLIDRSHSPSKDSTWSGHFRHSGTSVLENAPAREPSAPGLDASAVQRTIDGLVVHRLDPPVVGRVQSR